MRTLIAPPPIGVTQMPPLPITPPAGVGPTIVNAGSRSRAMPAATTSVPGNGVIASSIAGHRCSWRLLGRDFAFESVAITGFAGSDFI